MSNIHPEVSKATQKVADNINRPQLPSVYDTVMALTLTPDIFTPSEQDKLKQAVNDAQRPAGSFLTGAWADFDRTQSVFSAQSALITTLAVSAGYTHRGWEIPNLERVIHSINELSVLSTQEIDDNIAAEVLIPTLIEWLTKQRSDFAVAESTTEYAQKLRTAHGGDKKIFYLLHTAFDGAYAFNSELLAFLAADKTTEMIPQTAKRLAQPNGFYGSLAATAGAAAFMRQRGIDDPNWAGLSTIRNTFENYNQEGLPHFAESRNFAFSWYMRTMIFAGLEPELLQMGLMSGPLLSAYWQIRKDIKNPEKGISWDSHNDNGDLDDTGAFVLAELALWRYGLIPDRILTSNNFDHFRYKTGDYYCFPGESSLPISAAVHAIFASLYEVECLTEKGLLTPEFEQQSQNRIEHLLQQVLGVTQGRFGVDTIHDKWHLSWTYVAEVLLSSAYLRRKEPYRQMLVGLVKEIVDYQNADGSWGITSVDSQIRGTSIETSYIINGLYQAFNDPKFRAHLTNPNVAGLDKAVSQALVRSSHYLASTSKTGPLAGGQLSLPKLYRGKVAYSLTYVDQASMWNAKHYANQILAELK